MGIPSLHTQFKSLYSYHGGYYRRFLPKIYLRKKNIRYDQFGQVVYREDDRKYHSGFPQRHSVCHEETDYDVGAPTSFRNARLMQNTPIKIRDTSQEPAGRQTKKCHQPCTPNQYWYR